MRRSISSNAAAQEISSQPSARAPQRPAQPVGVLVQVLERDGLRADVPATQHVVAVRLDREHLAVAVLDDDAAHRLAETAGPVMQPCWPSADPRVESRSGRATPRKPRACRSAAAAAGPSEPPPLLFFFWPHRCCRSRCRPRGCSGRWCRSCNCRHRWRRRRSVVAPSPAACSSAGRPACRRSCRASRIQCRRARWRRSCRASTCCRSK